MEKERASALKWWKSLTLAEQINKKDGLFEHMPIGAVSMSTSMILRLYKAQ